MLIASEILQKYLLYSSAVSTSSKKSVNVFLSMPSLYLIDSFLKIDFRDPKAEEIKADNEIRMEWNRSVDRALVSGVSDEEAVGLKKTEITEKVKESVGQNGNNPQLFGEIVKATIALLECLIAKVLEKVKNFAEQVIDKTVDAAKEMQKESEKQVHAKDEPMIQAERKKIPVPVNLHRESDMKKNTEHPATASTEKESIAKRDVPTRHIRR